MLLPSQITSTPKSPLWLAFLSTQGEPQRESDHLRNRRWSFKGNVPHSRFPHSSYMAVPFRRCISHPPAPHTVMNESSSSHNSSTGINTYLYFPSRGRKKEALSCWLLETKCISLLLIRMELQAANRKREERRRKAFRRGCPGRRRRGQVGVCRGGYGEGRPAPRRGASHTFGTLTVELPPPDPVPPWPASDPV